ncbi:MAG: bifunctional 4-hydroxy-3-methylbut-2-enyl diphosphate reductase/30S ribosomal protein S1 [Ruminococcus sp.]|nr:bifunctional 4-hydroxy-3-methylbut-2-enyl diphosphate reductase/30S ribosomal protein S1 [Ruminococcus sp.]
MAVITVAKSAGFCFGVDRAVKMTYEALDKYPAVATLGPIIHNNNVVDDMLRRGARIIDNVSELRDGECAVIRSHGVSRSVYDELEAMGNPYIDATCPFVAKIHKIVAKHTAEGDYVLIAGDANHPEVAAIVGHCKGNCTVFEDDESLLNFFRTKYEKLGKRLAIVAQTTYNILVWEKCINALPKDDPNIMVYDTICHATQVRQSDADELSKRSDLMIIAGGKHSSNTVKLFDVCRKNCRSYHIETSDELYTLDLRNARSIGITAGASTPAHIIEEVKTTMTEIMNEDNMNFEELLDQSFKKIHTGEKVKGTVVAVNSNEAVVEVGTKHTGYVKLEELTNDPSLTPADVVKVGDEIDLIVIKINDQEGIAMLSKKKVDEQKGFEEIIKAKEEETVLEGIVQSVVKGGVIVTYAGVRVFIPASQSGLPRNAELDVLLKTKAKFVILEVNEGRRRAVGSIKAVLKAERDAAKAKFWEEAEVGSSYKGEVKSLTNYGAFVDLGGIDGMVHISELSWKRLKHPSEVVNVGDFIEVYIKEMDKETGRISLGYKKTEDNPWDKFSAEYSVGDVISVKIVSVTPFGAFAQIIDGVDGLIHISQLANKRVDNVKDIVSVGDTVDVKIIDVDLENKRISISIRALLEDNAAEAAEAEEAADAE